MAFDNQFKFVDGALNTAPNTNVYPNAAGGNGFGTTRAVANALVVGRKGLPFHTQFVTIVEGLASAGNTGTAFAIALQISLDNGANWREVARHTYDQLAGPLITNGKQASSVFHDYNPQEYANANVLAIVQVIPVGSNTSNNTTASKVAAFLATGENTVFGRQSAADTLFV